MKSGDCVTWTFTAGRYSQPVLIDAVVLKATSPGRVIIKFTYKVGDEYRNGHRLVLVSKLSPRTQVAPKLI